MKLKISSRIDDWTAEPNAIVLRVDHWNDYSYETLFQMSVCNEKNQPYYLGDIKIGFIGQSADKPTYHRLEQYMSANAQDDFHGLGKEFFSLGQDVSFYKKIKELPNNIGRKVLHLLRDVVAMPEIIDNIKNESVFRIALLREISLSQIKGQYYRVLNSMPELTDFRFKFSRAEAEKYGKLDLSFIVKKNSTPSTNIHALIGRNGAGKTTILNNMISTITCSQGNGRFIDLGKTGENDIPADYFSRLISVSFSAFDPFPPPPEQNNPADGTCYFYIGLKDQRNPHRLRDIAELHLDCVQALINCFSKPEKTERWHHAIDTLSSDLNFSSMELKNIKDVYDEIERQKANTEQIDSSDFQQRLLAEIEPILRGMSSGHAVVFFTITRLVAYVEEKTLVLMDEPESHLHPPLLSAFMRALSDLLYAQNGVAIIATHSPVVLQEIPKSCVWKIYRNGSATSCAQPEVETFGENVGLLTREIFGLEVENSGFHNLLAKDVADGKSYDEIIMQYDNQIGFEARAILRALVVNRDRSKNHAASE